MKQRALLIFADSAHTDCQRRGWPSAFRILLETQNFDFDEMPAFDIHLFTSRSHQLPDASTLQVHFQEGASFGQRLENAIEYLARLGYREIVIVGRDCPQLEHKDIRLAFDLLQQYRLVLGPDHRGGCYLIGVHADDRGNLYGIRWQQNTDCEEIRHRFDPRSTVDLPVKLDLDTLEDVWLLADSKSRFAWVARGLIEALLTRFLMEIECSQPWFDEERIDWQLPPPVIH
jgi:2-phospho-L-lactate guanylyltransferase (CobY/MobA/RfbA family)